MDSRFCSLTACLKNAKNTKGQSAICEGLEKYKKHTKIQIAFLDVMEKYKKMQKYKVYFLYFICICFVFFLYFYQKEYEKHTNKIHKIRMQLLKNTKYKKKYESTISKIQNTKKNTNPKVQKYKIQRKDKFKNKPESQPRVHFWKSGTKIQKKIWTNQLYFPNPAVLILYFWVVCFSYFFGIFKYWEKTLL